MPSDSADKIRERIAFYSERAGINPELIDENHMKKALVEIEAAAQMVRKGIERNDEPASAFHARQEKRP